MGADATETCPTWEDHVWQRVWPPAYATGASRGAPMYTCTACGEPGWEI